MHLSYNEIEFKLLRFTDFSRSQVWTEDHTNYLYDSIQFRCECILNPGATSCQSFFGAVQEGGRSSPVVTYNLLARTLKQPRGKLKIWMDSSVDDSGRPVGNTEIILESPLPGYSVDARAGPQCVVHRLDSSHGQCTLWLDLEFTTDINTCPEASSSINGQVFVNPMIANRYTQSIDHDPSNFTVIQTTSGVAHFRKDLLEKYTCTPDQFRKFFIHPIPFGFRRDPPSLVLSPDGCSISYEFTDREQLLSFTGGQIYGATEISVVETRAYLKPKMSFF